MQFLSNQDAYRLQKKSLKIPKEQSESINGGRTDNTIAKRNRTKGQKRYTKHTYKTIDRVIRPPMQTWVEFPTSIKILKKVTKKWTTEYFTITYRYMYEFTYLFYILFSTFT